MPFFADLVSGSEKGPAGAHGGGDQALQPTQPHFTAHVGAFTRARVRVRHNLVFAADHAYGTIGEVCHHVAQAPRLEKYGGVGKDEDGASRGVTRNHLGVMLPPSWRNLQQAYLPVRECTDD